MTPGDLYIRLQRSGWKVNGNDAGLYFFRRRRKVFTNPHDPVWVEITMDSDGNLFAGRGNDGARIKVEDALK